jgi:hypothetical protein
MTDQAPPSARLRELAQRIEDKFFVAGQMDAQGREAEKWKVGSGGPVLAMSRRLLEEARADIEALVREPTHEPEATFRHPTWYLECRLHGHDADSVNVREGGGHTIQCRIYRCLECDRRELVEPLRAEAQPTPPPSIPERELLSYSRLLELCDLNGISETDDLKHRLEEWERWNREIRVANGLKVESGEAIPSRPTEIDEHDPLCSKGTQAGDQTMPCDCSRGEALGRVPPAAPDFEELATDIASERENFGFDTYQDYIARSLRDAYQVGVASARQESET